MKVLLDTHILLWTLTNDARLPVKARKMIENPDHVIYYSILSPWEVEIKRMAHPNAMPIGSADLVKYCIESGFQQMPLREEHIFKLSSLQRGDVEPPHRDPFDRMMICQCITEDALFVTHDSLIAGYLEPCIVFV